MKRLILSLLILSILAVSCNEKKFADMNQDPQTVTEPDLRYLFTNALQGMESGHYTQWFYDNSQYMQPWTQATSGQGGSGIPQGNESQLNLFQEEGNRVGKWYDLMSPLFEIRNFIENRISDRRRATFQYLKAVTYPIQVYYGIRVTDVYGARPYTEAMEARYTNPPKLKPEWDTQEELFNTWLEELNTALETLASEPTHNGEVVNQVSLGNQDFVYGGNWDQWARFINSLKLRIAVRLLHQDRQRALSIAEEVMNNQWGPITSNDDNFYWSPHTEQYGPANNFVAFGHGSRHLMTFMRENQDPRMRFLYNKNDFNSMVVQGFFDAGKEENIPSYIRQYIRDTVIQAGDTYQGNTVQEDSTVFLGWKEPGAPWVRYFGAPVAPDSARSGEVAEEYFRTQNWRLESKNYEPKSLFKLEMYGTAIDFTYPDIPGRTEQTRENYPYHACLYSAAETNLYLAEFKLLGADIPNTAQSYFNQAIEQSVETYDKLGSDNGLLYYDQPYDSDHGASIKLKEGEIQQLMNNEAYTLSGSQEEKLEKIYIQQYLNFLGRPTQLFVTARRSGIPKKNSEYLSWATFWDGGVEMTIPRRFGVDQPTEDNINYQNILNGLEMQGFTPGNNEPQTLNEERIWYDEGAPGWGEGPNY